MKKITIIFILLLSSKLSKAQLYLEGNMLATINDFEIINSSCDFINGAKLLINEKSVEIIWKTLNDTVPGIYMIYKSHDFNELEFVDRIYISEKLISNISLINSVEDFKPDSYYNFYHIFKIKKNENINLNLVNIKKVALVNLPYIPNYNSTRPINRPFSYINSIR